MFLTISAVLMSIFIKNIGAEPKDLFPSAYPETTLQSPLNPELLVLPAEHHLRLK